MCPAVVTMKQNGSILRQYVFLILRVVFPESHSYSPPSPPFIGENMFLTPSLLPFMLKIKMMIISS